jgi:hypothetical protein
MSCKSIKSLLSTIRATTARGWLNSPSNSLKTPAGPRSSFLKGSHPVLSTIPLWCKKSVVPEPRQSSMADITLKRPKSSARCGKDEWTPSSFPMTASRMTPLSELPARTLKAYMPPGPPMSPATLLPRNIVKNSFRLKEPNPVPFLITPSPQALALTNALEMAGSTDPEAIAQSPARTRSCHTLWQHQIRLHW